MRDNIFRDAGLTHDEIVFLNGIIETSDINMELYGHSSFWKLMDYFSDEMPYSVKKAETGEPDWWILEKIS